MRILVLDDNPADRQLVMREISALYPDAEVVEILEGETLDHALQAGAPDLFITDLHAQWIDGREVLRRVKEKHPETPVIMFTGTGSEEVAVEAMKEGLDDYIVKSARQLPRLRASIKQTVEGAERKRALSRREAELEAALAHKELILRELHHRVKNNIQVMQSLLWTKARRARDPQLKTELDEISQRMGALAAVQARILDRGDLDEVDFRAVLDDMTSSLAEVYANSHIAIERRFESDLVLDVSRAVPLGLLVYEVLLNSLKHGFPDGRQGRVVVSLQMPDDGAIIGVEDDGVGLGEAQATEGMGSRLVRGLAEEARVEVVSQTRPGGGTVVTVRLRQGPGR